LESAAEILKGLDQKLVHKFLVDSPYVTDQLLEYPDKNTRNSDIVLPDVIEKVLVNCAPRWRFMIRARFRDYPVETVALAIAVRAARKPGHYFAKCLKPDHREGTLRWIRSQLRKVNEAVRRASEKLKSVAGSVTCVPFMLKMAFKGVNIEHIADFVADYYRHRRKLHRQSAEWLFIHLCKYPDKLGVYEKMKVESAPERLVRFKRLPF